MTFFFLSSFAHTQPNLCQDLFGPGQTYEFQYKYSENFKTYGDPAPEGLRIDKKSAFTWIISRDYTLPTPPKELSIAEKLRNYPFGSGEDQ